MFTAADLQKRFHEAVAERNAIQAAAAPVRAEYDAIRNEIMQLERDKLAPVLTRMQAIEAPLFDLMQEIAMCARALGGKTGEPPSVEVPE